MGVYFGFLMSMTTTLLPPKNTKSLRKKSTRAIDAMRQFSRSIGRSLERFLGTDPLGKVKFRCYFQTMATRYALNKNKYLLDPEVEKLESLLQKSSSEDRRDTLILSLALRTGARASELLGLRHADLNSYDGTLFIRGIKGSNDRELPIEPRLFEKLLFYSEDVAKNENLFPIGYHRLRQVWDWYRPVPKKFHSLRHTFAIRLYRKTKDLRLVQVALGHRNITNTMIYADYVYSQQELKKLIL